MTRVSLMLAASLVLAACSPTESLRLGFLGGLSGRSYDLAEAARNGVLLAIEQRNLAGGIDGRAIELVVRDDGEKPGGAAQGAAELVASGVVAIIGPITSSMVEAALPVIEKAKVVMVTPTATAMQLVGKDDHLFRINATTRDYAHVRQFSLPRYRAAAHRRRHGRAQPCIHRELARRVPAHFHCSRG
ncbi:MAG: ABC transporter substrate-binding protein [Comamonadaceae bacterium]|nr:ABC transporter substrate-binding protein [Comamonadaceae bacterium]